MLRLVDRQAKLLEHSGEARGFDEYYDRAIGMLTAIQVIICPTGALVPALDDAAPVLRQLALRPGGAYATLVTGPSRTADIERVLTVGVQGPGRVIVFFVDDLG